MSRNQIKKIDILKIYTDGAARGNPGPAAYSFIFVHDKEIIHQRSGYIGTATNNTAEYQAIINALKTAEKFHRGHLQIFSDSNLAIQQINKKWKINYQHLAEMCNEVYKLSEKYKKVEFFHVSRNNPFIKKCDELCNAILDSEGSK
ncbi:MAG: ribonuclease HI family protein [Candidatus Hermodarchaeota archaeon]